MAFMLLFVLCCLSATHVLSQPGNSGVNTGGPINPGGPNIPANSGNPGQPVISSNPNNPSGNAGNPNFPSGFPNGPGALPGSSGNGAFPGAVPGAFPGNSGNYPNVQPGYPSSYGSFGNNGGSNYLPNQINGFPGNYQPGIGGNPNLGGNFQSGYPGSNARRNGGRYPVCRYDESPTNGCPICEGSCTNLNPPCPLIACAPNNQQNYPNYNNPGQSNGFNGGYPGNSLEPLPNKNVSTENSSYVNSTDHGNSGVGNSGNPYGSPGNPSGNPYGNPSGNPYGNSGYGSGNPYSNNQAYATLYNRPCQCLQGLVRYQGRCIPQQWCTYFGFASNNNANPNVPANGQAGPVPGK